MDIIYRHTYTVKEMKKKKGEELREWPSKPAIQLHLYKYIIMQYVPD